MIESINAINAPYYGIQAATCGNITYVRNYKCASSYFYKTLVELYQWKEIGYREIDWNSKVFSHIRHPIDRRHKGLAHWVFYNLNGDIDNPYIAKIIQNSAFLDNHSASYTDTFGDDCYKIDWIPVDIFNEDKVSELTTNFLAEHGQYLLNGFLDTYKNESCEAERRIYSKIKQAFDSGWKQPFEENPNYSIYRYFINDINLYNDIIKKFNPLGNDWVNISWLRG